MKSRDKQCPPQTRARTRTVAVLSWWVRVTLALVTLDNVNVRRQLRVAPRQQGFWWRP